MRTYEGFITSLPENGIYVFGSNTQGRHGKGSAFIARLYFGAIYGQPKGFQGKSYAIVTKDLTKFYHPSVSGGEIIKQTSDLYEYAYIMPETDFYMIWSTKPNLNSYMPEQMADMFSAIPRPDNIIFEKQFSKLLTI